MRNMFLVSAMGCKSDPYPGSTFASSQVPGWPHAQYFHRYSQCDGNHSLLSPEGCDRRLSQPGMHDRESLYLRDSLRTQLAFSLMIPRTIAPELTVTWRFPGHLPLKLGVNTT